jgi:hypothetical protein
MVRSSVFRTVMTAAAAVLLLVSLPAEAQWKWKDKGGRIQYSDLPPPVGTPEQDILSKPSAPRRTAITAPAASQASAPVVTAGASGPASGPLAPRTVDPELEAKRKKAETDLAAKNKAQEERIAAAKADNCNRARTQLRTIDTGVRLTRANEKGEREYLDDKQRAEETKRAKDAIAADCK